MSTMDVQVTGNPTPEELAAVMTVLLGRSAATAAEKAPTASRWAARPPQLRRPLPHGPGAWRQAF